MRFDKKIVIFFFLCFACSGLAGCAVGASAVGVHLIGAAHLSKDRADIRVTEDTSIVKNCQLIKHVKSSTGWGGQMRDKALEKVIADLTHDSAEAGANTLLITFKRKAFYGSSAEGDAYHCPDTLEIPSTEKEDLEAKTWKQITYLTLVCSQSAENPALADPGVGLKGITN